ncbi:hypothetical protein Maes01_00264 [Microbulbifer aestuariivivens]|uniref:Uncharacterized protein n=1 Tax=Microbulbifer aestuariivivens TaxID=1908308 RepID=A0ABP9WKI6_9GAMM
MPYVLITLGIIALIAGPQLWVRFVLWRHSNEISDMPGSGAELAEHLIERYKLDGVKVVKAGKDQNYYSPSENSWHSARISTTASRSQPWRWPPMRLAMPSSFAARSRFPGYGKGI